MIVMWPFRRKKVNRETPRLQLPCAYCGSTNTRLVAYHGSDQPDYVRVWRGERYATCQCLDCGKSFYSEEPPGGVPDEMVRDEGLVDNEEELRAAEEAVKREAEEEDDRMCR